MINEQLLDYIRQHLSAGEAKEDIKETLVTQGWNEQDVNEAFAAIIQTSHPLQQVSTQVQGVSTAGIKNNKGKFIVLVLFVLLVFLTPLSYNIPFVKNMLTGFTQSLVPKDTDQFFRQCIALLKDNNIDQAYSLMSPQMRQTVSTSALQTVATYFINTTNQAEIVGAKINSISTPSNSEKDYDITYEIQNNDNTNKYLLVEIIASDTGNGLQILGIHAIKEMQSIKEQGKFNFSTQGIYLILSLLIPLFIVYTALRYIRKAQKPKWILFLVILLVSLFISVTNNSVAFHIGAYGFMSKSGLWGPWIFMIPIPLGAIYYYFVRRRLEKIS
jgi:hypothetical protein